MDGAHMKHTSFGNISDIATIRHCISERDIYQPLEGSVALHTGQERRDVLANRDEIASFFGAEAQTVSPLQVHGSHVHVVDEKAGRGWMKLDTSFRADALVTNLPGVVLTILTADCVPLLIADPVRRAVGAVHAGWRGTQQEITRKTVETMTRLYGTRPEDLIVGIGPAIGGCCYEVGEEVVAHFTDYPEAVVAKPNGKYLLDTKQINARQLKALGVPPGQIEISPVCTSCEHERFFSYRADRGTAGRFMSCIMMENKKLEIRK